MFNNILITGGCGFIASNLINYMVIKYPHINIYNVDKLDYCSSVKNITVSERSNYKFIKGDIKSNDLIRYILTENDIDAVFHFAAQSHVDSSINDPILFTVENVLGTHRLLDECYHYGKLKLFLHVSTDEVYGSVSDKVSETAIMNPTNPYSATKAAAECIVNTYLKSYNMPIIITRCNNVFGPYQYPEKIMPKFILLLLNNKKCTIQGDGHHQRNYIYTEDAVNAFDTIIHKGKIGEIYNIGTDNEYSNLNVAHTLIKHIISDKVNFEEYISYVPDRKCNDDNYSINSSKLKDLGWVEEISFNEGIQKTIEWYRDNNIYDHWPSITLSISPPTLPITPPITLPGFP